MEENRVEHLIYPEGLRKSFLAEMSLQQSLKGMLIQWEQGCIVFEAEGKAYTKALPMVHEFI